MISQSIYCNWSFLDWPCTGVGADLEKNEMEKGSEDSSRRPVRPGVWTGPKTRNSRKYENTWHKFKIRVKLACVDVYVAPISRVSVKYVGSVELWFVAEAQFQNIPTRKTEANSMESTVSVQPNIFWRRLIKSFCSTCSSKVCWRTVLWFSRANAHNMGIIWK